MTSNDNNGVTWNEEEEVTVSGLSISAPADKIRVRIKNMSVGFTYLPDPNTFFHYVFGSVSVNANDVQYTTTSTRSYASMTPNQEADPDERVRWTAASAQ